MPSYKQRCMVCKNSYVLVKSSRQKFVTCIDCEMIYVKKPIENKKMAEIFDIPVDWYMENYFLRSIRYQYGRWGTLTERQLEAFKKAVEDMKKEKAKK
ncbi:MAG: hypothetical protein Q8Q42_04345 [Nanoarchaeota archaeon]|nr:hypothetical protein [Nanoarchaeota archaeon]